MLGAGSRRSCPGRPSLQRDDPAAPLDPVDLFRSSVAIWNLRSFCN
jgi:hypothetical protein